MKEYSKHTYKIAAIGALLCGVISLVLGIVFLLIDLLIGLFLIFFSTICFVMWRKFRKNQRNSDSF